MSGEADRPEGDRPEGDRPEGDRPEGDRPDAGRPVDGEWSDSPVLAVRTRVEAESGRWVLYLDVVRIPDRDDYVATHRLGDYASYAEAMTIARFVERGANREMPHPPLGF